MVASEARPFATSGGLAEVLGGLPLALDRLGHSVTVIVPNYRIWAGAQAGEDHPRLRRPAIPTDEEGMTLTLDFGTRQQSVRYLRQALTDRVSVVLIDAPELYGREALYGTSAGDYPDNAYRFAVLSRAALEYVRHRGERPSVLHAHDWQAGLVPAYQKMLFSSDPVIGGVPAVFSIHNLAFQGLFPAATLPAIGLPWDVLHVQAMEFWGQISFLKAGINFSERLTTVSPTYAREILTPELGFGFDGVLRRRASSLVGILNGIDAEWWDPAADPFLPTGYTAEDLSGKTESKRRLLETVGMASDEDALARPAIGLVSRMTDQKGFDLISQTLDELMSLDATWILLGSGDQQYEGEWTALAARFPGRVSATLGFNDRLEHLIVAGADAFLMPSRFEPCGLNQLNSLRYGTLPIVRATGGLQDTVRDAGAPGGAGTGFKFADYTPEGLLSGVRRALEAYRKPDAWKKMQRRAMKQVFSWDVSAREYVKVYRATS